MDITPIPCFSKILPTTAVCENAPPSVRSAKYPTSVADMLYYIFEFHLIVLLLNNSFVSDA